MTRGGNNSKRRLAALRASVLVLFLPAHVAFVLLIDLNFIPNAAPPATTVLQQDEDTGPDKERLRLHLLKGSEFRVASLDDRTTLFLRHLDPWGLPSPVRPLFTAGEDADATLTKPASILIWLAATPHSHRAPPV